MMSPKDIPQIAELSVEEKIPFLEEMWDTISNDEDRVPVPQSHKDELNFRLKQFLESPGDLLTLEELQSRIKLQK